ncbi:MAG: diguanylate cyclase [Deltaproteobacteria bacterium]|nr:diguanylate cyclase [Deltaproteobacteria bacterium]
MVDGPAFFTEFLEQLNEGVYIVDHARRITSWNRAAEMLTGFRREEVLGACCSQNVLRHVDATGRGACAEGCPLLAAFAGRGRGESEMFFRHKDGHRVPVLVRVVPILGGHGHVDGAIQIFHQKTPTEEMQKRLVELEKLALIDPLTALPNRRHLEAQLRHRLDELRRYDWPFGALLLDVDRFKQVNDGHGHGAGDDVLKMVGKTLTACTRGFDTVGRWGGDEFLAVLANVQQRDLEEVAERFRVLVSTACLEAPDKIQVTISIGAALAFPQDTVESLLGRADKMLYEAKRSGGNRVSMEPRP